MKKRILIIFTLFVFALTNSSCDSWLDVTPQAQVNAEKLFSKPKGFENALYGIYTSMTDASSYGTHMTFGLMDARRESAELNNFRHTHAGNERRRFSGMD